MATLDLDGIANIDPGILPLLRILNEVPYFETWGSCEGHPARNPLDKPYVGLYVRGLKGVQFLAETLRAVNDALLDEDSKHRFNFDVQLVWNPEIGTAFDMRVVPKVCSFDVTIDAWGFPVEPADLDDITRAFAAAVSDQLKSLPKRKRKKK